LRTICTAVLFKLDV